MARKNEPRIKKLNNGAVMPQRRVVTKRQTTNKGKPFTVRRRGGGNIISNIELDDKNAVLTIERETNAKNQGVDSVRTASVASSTSKVDEFPEVESWFDDGSGSDSLMLPDDYEHGDPLPELPEGLMWMRLLEGSMRSGLCAWDADADETEFERTDEDGSKDADIIRAEVTNVGGTSESDAATIDVFFSQPIQENEETEYNSNALSELIIFSSTNGRQLATGVEVDGNKLTLTCDRIFDIRETCTISIRRGLFANNSGSKTHTLVGRGPRFCYVIAINRARTGGQSSVDSNSLIGNVTNVRDTKGNEFPVFDTTPLGARAAQLPSCAKSLGATPCPSMRTPSRSRS